MYDSNKAERVRLHLGDSLEAMKQMEDNAYELAIVDPPYGIGIDKAMNNNKGRHGFKVYRDTSWDSNTPNKEYFIQLKRVSLNYIIWGANYMMSKIIEDSQGWVVWNKVQRDFTMSDAELAFTSFNKTIRCFDYSRGSALGNNNKNGGKIHPTQKPVKLYEWLLDNYAKEGDRILDTHLGSGSIAIACHNRGYSLDAYEIDEEYYNAATERLRVHQSQLTIF